MGNLINPTSFRLGSTKFWNSTWALSSNTNYSFLNTKNIMLTLYLEKLLGKISNIYFKKGFLIGSLKFIQSLNFLNILLYFKFDKISELGSDIVITLNRMFKKRNFNFFFFKKIKRYKRKVKTLAINEEIKKLSSTTKTLPFTIDIATPDVNALHWSSFFKYVVALNSSKKFNTRILYIAMLKEIYKFFIQNFLFKRIKLFLTSTLKNFWYSKFLVLNFNFINYAQSAVTSASISRFVVTRLKQRFPVRSIINTLLRQMQKLRVAGTILGFKITCSGRFARRGRASFIWEDTGKIAESVLKLDVDYTLSLVTLINSICGIKVWIIKNKQPGKLLII